MLQPKARRFVPVLVLTTALAFFPLASASAATSGAPQGPGLLAQLEAQALLIWDALRAIWVDGDGDVGGRMDPNG